MAYLGKTPSQAVRQKYTFTATGGETSISGADDSSNTLSFTDGEYVDVYLNGVLLVAGTDYNTTTANTIGGLSALSASDVVEIVVYDTFSVFGGNVNGDFTVSNGTLTAKTITASGTEGTPVDIYRNSTSPVYIKMRNDDGSTFIGAEDYLSFWSGGAADGTGATERMRIDSSGRVGIGTSSPNAQLEIESADSSSNASLSIRGGASSAQSILYMGDGTNINVQHIVSDHGDNSLRFHTAASGLGVNERMRIDSSGNVGIRTTSPLGKLHVQTSDASIAIDGSGDELILENASSCGLTIGTPNNANGNIFFSDPEDAIAGVIQYNHSADFMRFYTDGSEAMRIFSDHTLTVGSASSFGGIGVYSSGLANSGVGYPVFARTSDAANAFYVRNDGLTLLGGTLNNAPYNRTTANAANMYIASNGTLYRSTSSGRFKTDVEDLDETHTNLIYDLRPVWYRSATGNDNPDWSWYGLIAEEVGEVDPRLVFWKTHEVSSNPDYNPEDPDSSPEIETPLETPVADGVAYERLIPHLINVVKTQKAELDAIKARIEALEGN